MAGMIHQFLNRHNALPEQIDAPQCLVDALKAMERGLSGQGNIPMIPSYLTTDITVRPNVCCAVEGSQFWKLTGFRGHFCREPDGLLMPYELFYEVVQTENACLIGAARAAFAKQM